MPSSHLSRQGRVLTDNVWSLLCRTFRDCSVSQVRSSGNQRFAATSEQSQQIGVPCFASLQGLWGPRQAAVQWSSMYIRAAAPRGANFQPWPVISERSRIRCGTDVVPAASTSALPAKLPFLFKCVREHLDRGHTFLSSMLPCYLG